MTQICKNNDMILEITFVVFLFLGFAYENNVPHCCRKFIPGWLNKQDQLQTCLT